MELRGDRRDSSAIVHTCRNDVLLPIHMSRVLFSKVFQH